MCRRSGGRKLAYYEQVWIHSSCIFFSEFFLQDWNLSYLRWVGRVGAAGRWSLRKQREGERQGSTNFTNASDNDDDNDDDDDDDDEDEDEAQAQAQEMTGKGEC